MNTMIIGGEAIRSLEAAQFDRVESFIGKIDGGQRRPDQAQPRRRVEISRRVKLPDDVVDVLYLRLFGDALDVVVCIAGSRERGHQMGWAAYHELEEVPGQIEAWRLVRGGAAPLAAEPTINDTTTAIRGPRNP
jgi:hypothetical protein